MDIDKQLQLYIQNLGEEINKKIQKIKENLNNKNYKKALEILNKIKKEKQNNEDFNFIYSQEELKELENLQYEIYIKQHLYVEALEESGFFYEDDGNYLKSSIENYENFINELNSRNIDI